MALENIFERNGYGPDGIKRPEVNLHVVDPENMTFVDRLRVAGITVFDGDTIILAAPDKYGILAAATIREYELLLDRALAVPQHNHPVHDEASILSEDWQQTA